MKKENVIKEKSFAFALKVIALYKVLVERKEYVLSKQLLRSGTSIGANVEESTAAQSTNDFIHKLSIASKEARETKYWLMLLQQGKLVDYNYSPYLKDINEIINILTSIIKTMQEKDSKLENINYKT
ncbi:MAG: four helix bundle protein [Chitinispirillales bacterium]|jgi:four helix bundle protein|nr:four helix bundle protein [Chitinispirillales bacterium]